MLELLLIRVRRRREALFLAVATLGSVLLNASMKLVFQRPRPQLPWAQTPLDYSFPSGHTMNGLVFYLALALVLWVVLGPRVGVVAVAAATVLAVLVGISRIYLGAHYFTDVAAGFLAGLAWLLVVSSAFDAGDWLARWRSRGAAAEPAAPPACRRVDPPTHRPDGGALSDAGRARSAPAVGPRPTPASDRRRCRPSPTSRAGLVSIRTSRALPGTRGHWSSRRGRAAGALPPRQQAPGWDPMRAGR